MESSVLGDKFVDFIPFKPKCKGKNVNKSNEICQNVRVMTYNIANFVDHKNWKSRCKKIAAEIDSNQPDFIGLQEVRYCCHFWGHNALDDIFKHMTTSYYVLFKSSMMHPKALGIKYCEGLAILSRYPFKGYQWESLPPSVKDLNKRIALTGIFEIPIGKELFIPFSFTVTHLTYQQTFTKKQSRAVKDCLDRIWNQKCYNQILVGDLNTFYGNTPSCFTEEGLAELPKLNSTPYIDTFPAWRPNMWLDRILYRGEGLKLSRQLVQERCSSKKEMSSDHLYVIADFEICNIK